MPPHLTPAAARSWHCRTAGTGTWPGCGSCANYGTFTTVAERLKPESLYNRFIDYRESLGFEMLPLTGGERPPFEVLAERLRDNRLVCLMADRDLTRDGVQVDFFGEPTRMPAGPAKLAIETGAAIAAGALLVHTRDGWGFQVQPPLDTSSGDVARRHAGDGRPVRRAASPPIPADWHMMQPQWLADLSDERRAKLEPLMSACAKARP